MFHLGTKPTALRTLRPPFHQREQFWLLAGASTGSQLVQLANLLRTGLLLHVPLYTESLKYYNTIIF